MKENRPYYIAETAFHHEGDVRFLYDLIDSFKNLKIDAIKFHLLFNVDDYMISNHTANETLKKISIPKEHWKEILENVKNIEKEIILLCNDLESLEFVNEIQNNFPISAVEIHSTGLNDIFLLKEAAKFKKSVILGIGGSSFDEIQFAVDFLKDLGKKDIILIHGFQNYPTNYSEINFFRMNFLKETFNLPIGYADHTDPNDNYNNIISILPLAQGFNIIEKHVTHLFGEKRIDSQAAISVEQMERLIELGNSIWSTKGDEKFKLSEAEKNYGNTGAMKKALVAKFPIKNGEQITLDNIAYKRTESSSPLLQKDVFKILNSFALKDIQKDEILNYENVKYEFKKQDFGQFFINK